MDIKPKDIFDIDRVTGQLIPLPIKWGTANKKNVSEEKLATKPKQIFDLKPLRLTAADFEEHQPKSKRMKVESKSVRKGLFTAPAPKPPQHRYSAVPSVVARRSVVSRNITSASKNKVKTPTTSMASPLLDLESCEEQLLKKSGYHFASPRKPLFAFTQTQKPNFNRGKSTTDSPISAMCNLLQNTGINSIKKIPRLTVTPSSSLKEIIETENVHFERLESSQIEEVKELEKMIDSHLQFVETLRITKEKKQTNLSELRKMHKERLEWLTKLFDNQNNPGEEMKSIAEKENSPQIVRRSIRLQSKSPVPIRNSKPAVSPVIPDLRKSTLKKNMAVRYQSPRTCKAMDMYNTFRELHKTVLETPKTDRSMSQNQSPNSSFKKNLSRKVLDQCMMLQDTPRH